MNKQVYVVGIRRGKAYPATIKTEHYGKKVEVLATFEKKKDANDYVYHLYGFQDECTIHVYTYQFKDTGIKG